MYIMKSFGWAPWLTPIIPVLWEAQAGRSPEVVNSRPAWPRWSLLKNTKLAGRDAACLWSQLLGRLRQENCLNLGGGYCSKLRSYHCTPAWVTRAKLCHKKNKKIKMWTWLDSVWLTPVIPTLWEAKAGGTLEVRSLRPVCPTWWNPISTKNTKN